MKSYFVLTTGTIISVDRHISRKFVSLRSSLYCGSVRIATKHFNQTWLALLVWESSDHSFHGALAAMGFSILVCSGVTEPL